MGAVHIVHDAGSSAGHLDGLERRAILLVVLELWLLQWVLGLVLLLEHDSVVLRASDIDGEDLLLLSKHDFGHVGHFEKGHSVTQSVAEGKEHAAGLLGRALGLDVLDALVESQDAVVAQYVC